MYQASDVMNRNVMTLHQDTPVGEAIRRLLEHEISGMPVVDDQGRLVGIISEFQLMEAIYTPEVKQHRVGNLMTRDVLTVKENAILSDIANMFILHRIRRIPVIRDGRMVGIVARRDLLRYAMETDEALGGFLEDVRTFAGA